MRFQVLPNEGTNLIKLGMSLDEIKINLSPYLTVNAENLFNRGSFRRHLIRDVNIDVSFSELGLCSSIGFTLNSSVELVVNDFVLLNGQFPEMQKSVLEVYSRLKAMDPSTILRKIKADIDDPGYDWGSISKNLGIAAWTQEEDGIDSVVLFNDDYYDKYLKEKW